MVYVTRRETFNAAHKLHVAEWTEEKNRSVFGKCSNKNWHGHNYQLFVTVVGTPDADTGFVMDAKELSNIIREEVTTDLDHSNINLDVKWFPAGHQPTTENITIAIWKRVEPRISDSGAVLHCVRLHETENIYAEYYGPNGK